MVYLVCLDPTAPVGDYDVLDEAMAIAGAKRVPGQRWLWIASNPLDGFREFLMLKSTYEGPIVCVALNPAQKAG